MPYYGTLAAHIESAFHLDNRMRREDLEKQKHYKEINMNGVKTNAFER